MLKAVTADHDTRTATPPIIMKPISSLFLASEAPKGVDFTVRDSASGSPLTDAELKASIYSIGIIQPLIFKNHEGKAYVIAGNRRLRLLREIFHDAPDSLVQTQDVARFPGDWRDIALDTNLSLPPHLVERYEQIVRLVKDQKLSPEDTQARFGMTPRQYLQVMALGRMSFLIREKWRVGAIDAKTAQAFTLEPDPKEQDRIYNALAKSAHEGRVESWDVKRKIIPETQREAGKLVAFVGVDICKAAGIIKQEDLFATDHIVTDMKALKKLADRKLSEACDTLTKDGWGWALPEEDIGVEAVYYGTVQPAKMGAAYPPEVKQKSGCILKIDHDGTLKVQYGRVKPEQRKAAAAASKPKAKPKKPGEATLSNALAQRLSEQLEKALAASLHATPHVAVAALIAAFASNGHIIDAYSIRPSKFAGNSTQETFFAQVFTGALKSTPEQQAVMLTKIAAEAISIAIYNAEAKSPLEDKGLQALVAAMDPKYVTAALFDTFDAKDYFSGVNLEACVEAVREAMGTEHSAKVAKMKKADAAKFAAANVPGTGWLPVQLRTVHYKGPRAPAPLAKHPEHASPKKAPAKKTTAKKAAKKTARK